MKNGKNISSLRKAALLCFGVVTALLVVFSGPIQKGLESQMLLKTCEQTCPTQAKESKKESEKAQVTVQAYDAIIPATLAQPAIFTQIILNLPFIEHDEEESVVSSFVARANYLKVLLGLIISPNAP